MITDERQRPVIKFITLKLVSFKTFKSNFNTKLNLRIVLIIITSYREHVYNCNSTETSRLTLNSNLRVSLVETSLNSNNYQYFHIFTSPADFRQWKERLSVFGSTYLTCTIEIWSRCRSTLRCSPRSKLALLCDCFCLAKPFRRLYNGQKTPYNLSYRAPVATISSWSKICSTNEICT